MAKHTKPHRLNARQKKLIALMPKVEAGEMTQTEALLRAGYAETTAREQQQVLGRLGNNAKMQEALAKAGFTEEYLAQGIIEGTQAKMLQSGEKMPDHRARGIFFKLGAELKDAFPAKKQINAEVDIAELIKLQEDAA